MKSESAGAKGNGPVFHLIAGFICFLVIRPMLFDSIRGPAVPWPSDWIAFVVVILGAFLSGVHALPSERLNGVAFAAVGALSGGLLVNYESLRWWAARDLAAEFIAGTVVTGALLTRLAGMAGKALNNPFGHSPD